MVPLGLKYELDSLKSPSVIFEENTVEDSIIFSNEIERCCVGLVDIVNSTRISASLSHEKLGKYYSIFLNSMGYIIEKFGGKVVKNIGDSLLYYFPVTSDGDPGLRRSLECSLAMLDLHHKINEGLFAEKLPCMNYRISIDYGQVLIAKSRLSLSADIFGPPVNMCSKINSLAERNGIVAGGDLYEIAKKEGRYRFHKTRGFAVGFKNDYPVYGVRRR